MNFDDKELGKLARKLKKEKVNVDIVCFGEEVFSQVMFPLKKFNLIIFSFYQNGGTEVLAGFINTLNGKDGTGSHLVTIPPGIMQPVSSFYHFQGLTIFYILLKVPI